MPATDRDLIEMLRQRNEDRSRATDGGIHPRQPFPPASAKDILAAERSLGFQLPELLKSIYQEVANGGFGPKYGIVGTTGGFKLDGHSLESCYESMIQFKEENSIWRWPQGLLPLANYGCGMWSCVDCDDESLPMILWDPNNLDAGFEEADAQLSWGNSFWSQGLSLTAWLRGWLAEKQSPAPKWPSDSWMQKRLGFVLPE